MPAEGNRLVADEPEGIDHVLVNGVPIRSNGKPVTCQLDALLSCVLRGAPQGSANVAPRISRCWRCAESTHPRTGRRVRLDAPTRAASSPHSNPRPPGQPSGRRFLLYIPSGKHDHGGMDSQGSSDDPCSIHSDPDLCVLDRRERRLGDFGRLQAIRMRFSSDPQQRSVRR